MLLYLGNLERLRLDLVKTQIVLVLLLWRWLEGIELLLRVHVLLLISWSTILLWKVILLHVRDRVGSLGVAALTPESRERVLHLRELGALLRNPALSLSTFALQRVFVQNFAVFAADLVAWYTFRLTIWRLILKVDIEGNAAAGERRARMLLGDVQRVCLGFGVKRVRHSTGYRVYHALSQALQASDSTRELG